MPVVVSLLVAIAAIVGVDVTAFATGEPPATTGPIAASAQPSGLGVSRSNHTSLQNQLSPSSTSPASMPVLDHLTSFDGKTSGKGPAKADTNASNGQVVGARVGSSDSSNQDDEKKLSTVTAPSTLPQPLATPSATPAESAQTATPSPRRTEGTSPKNGADHHGDIDRPTLKPLPLPKPVHALLGEMTPIPAVTNVSPSPRHAILSVLLLPLAVAIHFVLSFVI